MTRLRTFQLMLLICSWNVVNSKSNSQSNGNSTKGVIRHQQTFETKLNHLVVDVVGNRIYIGAVNNLYQLTPDLEVKIREKTGPRPDSPECSPIECPPNVNLRPTDNTNKVLLLDYQSSHLIVCGTLSQGTCHVRSMQNISNVEQEIQDAVVANNDEASTYAFIAAGPPAPPTTSVMYVGVTYINNSPYRGEIPAVASRSLQKDRMFQIAVSHVTTGTRMFINTASRDTYPVKYVYGFSSEKFSYFLTYQLRQPGGNEWISKLVRLCQEDSNYYSYTEIPIECISEDGTKYNSIQAAFLGRAGQDLAESLNIETNNDVLYALFSQSNGHQASNRSALCVYSLKSIRRKFMQNIKACFNGEGSRGLDFISPSMKCVATRLQSLSEDFCGLDVNSPLGGEMPVTAAAAATFNTEITAIAATTTSSFTVVFIGTAKGHLKKLTVENANTAVEYADIVIDEGSSINPDMFFDKKDMNVYVMSEKKISKVRVHECSVHKTCGECLSARDSYCGWCSSENKCTLRSNCQDDGNDPLYWVNYKNGKCTFITSVTPHQLQRTTARNLELVIDHLPNLKEHLVCAFSTKEKTIVTNATRNGNIVNCTTPRTDLLPQIEPGKHHFTARLSVKTASGPDLVFTNFTFFDCSTHLSCTRCVSSLFPCDWCVDTHRCTHDTAENCRNDIMVNGVNRMGPSYRSGPAFCPAINVTDLGTEILVPAGVKRSVKVRVHVIGHSIVQTRYVCQFNIEGRVSSVNAQLLGDTIYCDSMEFMYTSKPAHITAPFAVIWDGAKPLDNPHNIHVVIYRCRDMADSCGMCLALPAKYGCGWCSSSNTCEVEEQCKGSEGTVDWLNRLQTCPNPEIHSFAPKTGPWEGGTNITITGINLGKNFSDIYSGVKIAGIDCLPYRELYLDTRQIVCRVEGPGTMAYRAGKIVVQVQDFRGESRGDFEFVDPVIHDFEPKFGPMSGGTRIHIRGNHLNAGSLIRASINGLRCEILSTDVKDAFCRTSPSTQHTKGFIKMEFDSGERQLNSVQFEYVNDPTISVATSGINNELFPKGIPSGGIKITVIGKNFKSIQMPSMYVYYRDRMFSSPCVIISDIEMHCDSPMIEMDVPNMMNGDSPQTLQLSDVRRYKRSPYTLRLSDFSPLSDSYALALSAEPLAGDILGKWLTGDHPLHLEYGFQMDDVIATQNLSKTNQPFQLYPDPIYYKFNEKKYYNSEYLTINGKNLDRACKESDVTVTIGNQICNITSLSRQQLTCKPPADGIDDVPVIVKIGQTLEFDIGILSYAQPTLLNNLGKHTLIMITVAIFIVIVFIIGLLIAYKKKTSESNRVLKNMQEQMDILELRVAAECKEAFAELQTEMTDLTGDLTSGGIPFLNYQKYAMNILFPNVQDHDRLLQERIELARKEKGLRLFGQLIMNKTFLLLFIRTLESNRYFSMRERVNVASLIMITLQSKLEYCTDILKTLLAELIEKCIDGKSHPKLLLRRTESVAEKMLSAWFTFLLHKFLKECAGEPLYMLFQALKSQVDKGPVDAVTHEARYSLSEEKLIRQLIEYKQMSIYASIAQPPIFCNQLDNMTCENVPVKVLDCDTISQVKEKILDTIYRACPYSQRPKRDEVDLEWRTGSSGRVILYDEDSTSKNDNEWKKLNTLYHYRVPDGAFLTLVSKQQSSNYNLSILSEKNEKSAYKYETLNSSKYNSTSPPFSRAGSPLNYDSGENGVKYWHLVKHHDSEQKEGERADKLVSEIYLTRLLATKGAVQKFVDDLIETIFSTAHRGSALPLAIKYIFDFLDDQAMLHGITDPQVVHTWKSNSLPLRFWVNLIKNPNFVFDVHKSNIVDSCLSVVAQTFMDSCSTSDHRLGKDSPSSKLLYAKDIPCYREWVERYYCDIRDMPAISDQDMNAMLNEESRLHTVEFNTNNALHELYLYAVKYNEQLSVTLFEDEFSKKQRLPSKLSQIHSIMSCE
ncbi:plexin-A4 [Chironomus tepperi]|uniref:plexin-A4 n=1 Tax=Chironomus tepperi TaxID=113505 RepID=UPI00391FC5D9